MKNNEWELLNPELKDQIQILNTNIVNLTKQNKELKNTVIELKDQIKNINKLNIEHTLMFNQIKTFLVENREKYMDSFNNLSKKIKQNKEKINEKFVLIDENNKERVKIIKDDINKQNTNFNKKIFDPAYRLRLNNLRWRNTGSLSLLNPVL